MSTYLKLTDQKGRQVLMEVDDPLVAVATTGEIQAGFSSFADKIVEFASEKAGELIAAAVNLNVQLVYEGIQKLSQPPKEIEIEFGLKFTGEGNVAIGKLGAEYNYGVKLTWK